MFAVLPDEGSVSQLCRTASELQHIPHTEENPACGEGNGWKAGSEASSWVITDIRKNSEMAGANTFISSGC